jgi:hypothetical protein
MNNQAVVSNLNIPINTILGKRKSNGDLGVLRVGDIRSKAAARARI